MCRGLWSWPGYPGPVPQPSSPHAVYSRVFDFVSDSSNDSSYDSSQTRLTTRLKTRLVFDSTRLKTRLDSSSTCLDSTLRVSLETSLEYRCHMGASGAVRRKAGPAKLAQLTKPNDPPPPFGGRLRCVLPGRGPAGSGTFMLF